MQDKYLEKECRVRRDIASFRFRAEGTHGFRHQLLRCQMNSQRCSPLLSFGKVTIGRKIRSGYISVSDIKEIDEHFHESIE